MFFSKFKYFMYFLVDRFLFLDFYQFQFLVSTSSVTGPVLITSMLRKNRFSVVGCKQ